MRDRGTFFCQVRISTGSPPALSDWGFVCDDRFEEDTTAAMLVCRGLGFPCAADGCAAVCNTDVGTEDFLVDDVVCGDPAAFDLNGPKGGPPLGGRSSILESFPHSVRQSERHCESVFVSHFCVGAHGA
jgi:hypothetical protein